MWKTIIEPFKIKSVEPLGWTQPRERRALLARASYNLFRVHADKVLIDLLTDSGTSAMSGEQWAGMLRGDTAYAGSRSWYRFESVVRKLTSYPEIIPVHQGRAGERILFSLLCGPGKVVLSNTFFDTTRANVEAAGAQALDLPVAAAAQPRVPADFKGDMDVVLLDRELRRLGRRRVPLVVMTLTNNSLGGHPVSLDNLRRVSRICARHRVPLFLDAARFAENAYLVKLRDPRQAGRSARDIASEMFRLAQGCLLSGKKDGLVNMGGFIALRDKALAERARERLILWEGFPTYGGLTGRDLEALAQGLGEALDESYLRYRIRCVEYLADGLRREGVPIVEPPGGHAVYVDAAEFLPHIPPERYPGQALACALYLFSGVRAVEVGSLMFGRRVQGRFVPARAELLRLAIPRRVYTQSHTDLLIEVFAALRRVRDKIPGLRLISASKYLPHFTAALAPLSRFPAPIAATGPRPLTTSA